jgi:2'-5' RNA ligase
MWKAFIMKVGQLSLELIALKNAINEIERDITILEEQRQLTRHIQIGRQLAFDFDETLVSFPK